MQESTAPYVLTLIAPAGTLLHVPQLVSSLPVQGEPTWLNDRSKFTSESTAQDVFLSRALSAQEMSAVKAACEAAKIDFILQPTAHRRKTLLISDMDSTMIENECIDEIARVMGKYEEVKAITSQSMGDAKNDFSASVTTRVGMVKGATLEQLQGIYDHVIKVMPGARTLLATMHALDESVTSHLVSGGFTFFSGRVGNAIGFTTHDANMLGFEGLQTNGKIEGEIIDGAKKKALLEEYAAKRNVDLADTLAVGDGSNDIPMLQAAGLGVAYHAKPAVEAAASASIRHCDLTALLYAQGIERSKWVWREPEVANGKSRA